MCPFRMTVDAKELPEQMMCLSQLDTKKHKIYIDILDKMPPEIFSTHMIAIYFRAQLQKTRQLFTSLSDYPLLVTQCLNNK